MKKTTGLAMIVQERQEQLEIQRYAPISDDGYINGELVVVAACIMFAEKTGYPKDWDTNWIRKTLNKSNKERLAIAGALIAAEIDRINKSEP